MSKLPDYYKLLGVKSNAPLADIKKAYRDLAKKYHPDIDSSKQARNKFDEIQKAYEVLEDEKTRRRYDTDFSLQNKRAKTKNYAQRPTGKNKAESDYNPDAGYKKYDEPEQPTKPKKEYVNDVFENYYEGFARNLQRMDYREKGGLDRKKKVALEQDKYSDHRGRSGRIKRDMSSVKEELELMDIQLSYLKVLFEYSQIMGSDVRFNPYRELHEEPSNLGYYAKKIVEYKKKIIEETGRPPKVESKKSFWSFFNGE